MSFVDGVNVTQLAEAVQAGDTATVRRFLKARPELVHTDMHGGDEHRALHFAVLRRDPEMVRLLMEAGADARKGIFPHRDATSGLAIARDRQYDDIVAIIEEQEQQRRAALSCPNATLSPAQDRIHDAMARAENDTAIALLENDLSLIHACDRNGATPLHIAAHAANVPMVEWLLERRANVRKPDMKGRTPLDRATLAGESEEFSAIAALLLGAGAELTIQGAVALGHEKRVRELLQADPAPLRQISSSGGLLTLAVNHGRMEMVQLLLDLDADPDERITLEELEEPTASWGMPLWHAALDNRYEIAKLLLDRGADPNANVYASGWPLRNAWNHPGGALKNLLLERGAKPQPYMAAEAHDIAEAKRLLEADPGEELAKELAWSAADSGCPEIVQMAVARLDVPRNEWRWWHWLIIQPIRGATADHRDTEGHIACMHVLMRRGVDPNVQRFGQTALHFAAAYHGKVSDSDRARFAAILLDNGARLDLRDDILKSTPLGWACRWGRPKLVELLLERGAPAEEPDAEPWATPKAWATKMNHPEILKMLR